MPSDYRVSLENFEGPLDLLLYLIQKNDLDINDISIAAITNEYLEYVELMQMLNIASVGEFMVMAATLMYIKSRRLLPMHDEEEQEELDEIERDLKAKLLEYKRYKEVAHLLKGKEAEFIHFHPRESIVLEKESSDYDVDATIFDLVRAFKDAYQRMEKQAKEIVGETVSVEEKMDEIVSRLRTESYINLTELFNATTKPLLIVTFLAMLELMRLKKICAQQRGVFGEIRVYAREHVEEVEKPVQPETALAMQGA